MIIQNTKKNAAVQLKHIMTVSYLIHLVLLTCFFHCQLTAPIVSNLLHTWWHNNSEYNDHSPVDDDNVRASTVYRVQVSMKDIYEDILYDSFTYMSIPRAGRDKWGYNDSDGAEFASQAKLTMSWSTFQYFTPVWVIITLLKSEDRIHSENDVIIRPTTLNFKKEMINNTTIRILIPYQPAGYR